jgi:hypothetical protein
MRFPALIAIILALATARAAMAGELTVYEFGNFAGRSLTAMEAIPNFAPRGFNDRAASAVIAHGMWELCADADFRGHCVTLGPGRYPDIASMGLDRSLSSVREVGLAPDYGSNDGASWSGGGSGGRVTLYDDFGFAGEPYVADGVQPDLHDQGYNDRARSMIVLRGQWEACSAAYYRGSCETFGPGRYANLGGLAGHVSSLRMVAMTPAVPPRERLSRAILYEGSGLTGRSFTLDNEIVANFAATGFNDRAASLVVEGGYWIFCSDANFHGECRTFGPGEYRRLPWDVDRKISSGRRIHARYPYSQSPDWSH